MVGQELHQDETALEPKTFAPGHGEWFSGGGHDFEANALAVPAAALAVLTPAELTTLSSDADHLVDTARSKDWNAAPVTVKRMISTWTTFRAGGVPERLGSQTSQALHALVTAVGAPSSTMSTAEPPSPGQASRFHTAVWASSHPRVNFSAVRSSDRGQPSRSPPVVVTTRSPSTRLPGVAPPGSASQAANHRVTGRVSTAMPRPDATLGWFVAANR
jgi:hypothetical protein